jgi:propanediol dehydratase small subunit
MDKVSRLAYLLFNESNNQEVKQVAVKLLIGDLTLKQVQNMKIAANDLKVATKKLKNGYIDSHELYKFVENHLYTDNESI